MGKGHSVFSIDGAEIAKNCRCDNPNHVWLGQLTITLKDVLGSYGERLEKVKK